MMQWKFPPFKYPSAWDDEYAVYGHYQAFKRSKEADPTAYNQKLTFWTVLIQDYCAHHHIVVVSEGSLKKHFSRSLERTGRVHEPGCLGTVLWEMWSSPSTLRPVGDFSAWGLVSKVAGVGFDWLVRRPAAWSWGLLNGSKRRERAIKSVESESAEFALLQLLPKLSDAFLAWLASNEFCHLRPAQDLNVLLKSHYEEALRSFFPDEPSRAFVHAWLLQNRRVAEKKEQLNSQTVEVVKFGPAGPVDFTEEDRSLLVVLQLRDLVARLEGEAKHLQQNLDERKAAVRGLLREKKRTEALRVLRRGKVVETALEQKHAQVEKVEALLLQIESSKGNRKMIGALSLANRAMKSALGDSSLDSLEDTLADLRDTVDQHQGVSDALADASGFGASDAELEEELEELLAGPEARPAARRLPSCDADDLDRELAELDLSMELPDVSNLPLPTLGDVQESLEERRRRGEPLAAS